jgi:hypothetical protein
MFTPLKLIGEFNPSIELSYSRKTFKRLSTQLTAAYLFPVGLIDMGNDFKPEIKGYSVGIEEKFYFKELAPHGPYFSVNFNYLNKQYKDIWDFGVEDIYSDTTYNFTNYTDTFGIKNKTYSFNFKLGYQVIVRRISFDFYMGLGVKFKNVTHFDRINPDDKMEMPRHPNINYNANREGKYWRGSMPLNLRIGWTF